MTLMKQLAIAAVVTIAATGATPTLAQSGSAVLDRIKARDVIRIGHREASIPFSYISDEGTPIGYSMDLCGRIVDEVKTEIDAPDLRVEYVPVTGQTRIPLIANGTIDMECGSTTNNLTRSKQVDFLAITFVAGTKLAVRKDADIDEIEDLDGKIVAVAQGTTNERAIEAAAEKAGIEFDVVSVRDQSQGFLALETRRVDAFASDNVLLFGLISKARTPEEFEVTGRFLSYDPYGIMVPRDDSTFRLLGNKVLADLMRSGEAVAIYEKWFAPGPTNIGMPLDDTLRTAFELQALPE